MFNMNTVSLQRFSRLFVAATLLSIISVMLVFTQAYGNVGEENPEIEVTPGSTSVEVKPGSKVTEALIIANNGQDPLSYTVSVANAQDCSDMSSARRPWLTVSETRGTVEPGESAQLSFTMKATKPGEYNGMLCVASNDPNSPVVEIPISMTVTKGNQKPDPGSKPGEQWDKMREQLQELIKRLEELLKRLG